MSLFDSWNEDSLSEIGSPSNDAKKLTKRGLEAKDINPMRHSGGGHSSWLFPTWDEPDDSFFTAEKKPLRARSRVAAKKRAEPLQADQMAYAYILRQLGGFEMRMMRQYAERLLYTWSRRTMRNLIQKCNVARNKMDDMNEQQDRAAAESDDAIRSLENQLHVKEEQLEMLREQLEAADEAPNSHRHKQPVDRVAKLQQIYHEFDVEGDGSVGEQEMDIALSAAKVNDIRGPKCL